MRKSESVERLMNLNRRENSSITILHLYLPLILLVLSLFCTFSAYPFNAFTLSYHFVGLTFFPFLLDL